MVAVDPNSLYDVDSLAVILGLSADAVRRLIRKGVIPARHIGRKWYAVGSELLRVAGQGPGAEAAEGADHKR